MNDISSLIILIQDKHKHMSCFFHDFHYTCTIKWLKNEELRTKCNNLLMTVSNRKATIPEEIKV